MNTNSHDVDTLEEAFDFALKIDLTFKGLLIAKAWEQLLSMRDMNIMIISAPQRVDMLELCQ